MIIALNPVKLGPEQHRSKRLFQLVALVPRALRDLQVQEVPRHFSHPVAPRGEFSSLHCLPMVPKKLGSFWAVSSGATKLRKHEDSHVKLETVEAFYCEYTKYFSNVDYLKDHMRSAHQLVNCNICGTKQLRKNIQRHLCTHEKKNSADSGAFGCDFEGCQRIFSTKSNLCQHVKAVHLEVRPFVWAIRIVARSLHIST
ncbi:hypothetical protein EUGRSUZ_A00563 [Eucalyptus grandis]|uniref:Uncharacterized protein n=2 Tax=Eucalyptus grandis TaxID=71139 RepID=A0ACC3M1C3_EUCGR|nr:hypothetical protein EUGRSUZ_A00563 [Eucalyptus grandis]